MMNNDTSTADDSSSYLGSAVIGLVLAALYFGSRSWLSESAFFGIAITVSLLYLVTGTFRSHWREARFWAALVVLFGAHITLLLYFAPRLPARSFWGFMKLGAPEWLAMTLILGWIVGDNYFTRNTRRRAQAAEQKSKKEERAAPGRHSQR